uniref:Uncharacterized protein n=1 Tax=Parascaris univalens TaxID=6257 RepID=A0A915ADY2_PARUN
MDADGKLSSTESVEEHNPLKRPLAIDRNPVMMKYSAQDQLAGMGLSKRPMTVGFLQSLAINGGAAGRSTLNMNYAMGLLPNSSTVAQPASVPPIMASSANGVISPNVVPAVNGIAGSPHGAASLNFSQSFQYQLAAMQVQAKAQQTQPSHILKQMQAVHEHSLAHAQVRAQAEAQARAHAEAQARVQAHAQAQARAQAQVEAAQAGQAQAQAQALHQAQQQAVAFAQQRSLINGGVTTAHEYYYAHAQRAASLPDYLVRIAAQQHSQVATPSSSTASVHIIPQSGNEHFLLHQHHHQQQQQQILQHNNALRQHSQQQQLQLAAAAAAAAAQQHHSAPSLPIPSVPRLPTISAPVMTSHSGLQAPISTPSTSASGGTSAIRMRTPTSPAMGPHDDRRYHEFLISVMQLERQIAKSLMTSSNGAEQTMVTANAVHKLSMPSHMEMSLLEKNAVD